MLRWTRHPRLAAAIALTRRAWRLASPRLRAFASALWRHRAILVALCVRVAWWSSLALLVRHVTALLDFGGPLLPTTRAMGFASGLALCLPVLVFGEHRYLRGFGVALALAHGLLLWFVLGELP